VLGTKLDEIAENITEIGNMLEFLKPVFVLRVKDSAAEIRSLCLEQFGVWVAEHPTRLMDDSNLKYVGWSLYDTELR